MGIARFGPGRCAAAALLMAAWSGAAKAATAGFDGWQEITVLTVLKLEHASSACGFRLGWHQVSVLLESANLTIDEVHNHPRGDSLQKQIDDDLAAYRADRTRACATAWATFGADADARDFLLPP